MICIRHRVKILFRVDMSWFESLQISGGNDRKYEYNMHACIFIELTNIYEKQTFCSQPFYF
jgi:hypothetical protein